MSLELYVPAMKLLAETATMGSPTSLAMLWSVIGSLGVADVSAPLAASWKVWEYEDQVSSFPPGMNKRLWDTSKCATGPKPSGAKYANDGTELNGTTAFSARSLVG